MQTSEDLFASPTLVSESKNSLDESAVELGVYFLLVTLCMFLLLDQFHGKLTKLQSWVLRRKLEVFKTESRNNATVERIIKISLYSYLFMPFLALGGWTFLIMYDTFMESEPIVPGWSILVMGLAYLCILANLFRIKWNNYRFKTLNVVLSIFTLICLYVYMSMGIFGYSDKEKFLPYSAIFLNFSI